MKRALLIILAVMCCAAQTVYARIYNGYILKSMSNTFVMDIGTDDGINHNLQYKLYYHKKGKGKAKKKSDIEFVGIVEITQQFPDASVFTFTLKKDDPKEGKYFSLIPMPENYSTDQRQVYPERERRAEYQPERIIEREKALVEPAKNDYKYSLSIGGITGYGNFPKAVSQVIEDYLKNDIYTQGGAVYTSLPPKGGFNVSVERLLHPYFSMRAGYGTLYYNRYIKSLIASNIDPATLPDEYIKNWRYKIKTSINTASCDLLFGNFGQKLYRGYRYKNYRGFVFYGGLGFDYASMNYSTNETITLHRYDRDDVVHDNNTYTLSGYWGIHGLAGLSYYFPAFRMYAEGGYTSWSKEVLKNSYPLKLGISIHF